MLEILRKSLLLPYWGWCLIGLIHLRKNLLLPSLGILCLRCLKYWGRVSTSLLRMMFEILRKSLLLPYREWCFTCFFRFVPTFSFSPSLRLHSLHLPHLFIFFITPLSFLTTNSFLLSFFSSHLLTLSFPQTLLFSHSLPFSHHLLQWYSRPRNLSTSYLLMFFISPSRVEPWGWWDLHHWHTVHRITFPWVNL